MRGWLEGPSDGNRADHVLFFQVTSGLMFLREQIVWICVFQHLLWVRLKACARFTIMHIGHNTMQLHTVYKRHHLCFHTMCPTSSHRLQRAKPSRCVTLHLLQMNHEIYSKAARNSCMHT